MSGGRHSGLSLQLLRIGRDAGRRSEAAGTRAAALALSAFAVALCLGLLAMVHATYAGKELRREARTPVGLTEPSQATRATLWLAGSDALKGKRLFSVVFIAPQTSTTHAPLPPGVDRWPGPGEAVLSPALLKAGAAEGIADRYGKLAGTIGQEGLDDPGEWLAYVRPAKGMKAEAPIEAVVGFGPKAGIPAEGLQPGMGRDNDKPEWMFQGLVIGLLLVPGLVLLFTALRVGAHGRDRRGALVDALGGLRRDRALIAVGEAIRPVTWGAFAAAPFFAVAAFVDIRVPFVGYVMSSADVRQHGWPVLLTPAAVMVTALALAVVSDQMSSRAEGTRPAGASRSRRHRYLAVLCVPAILLASRGPELAGDNTQYRTWISWIGLALVVLTLPAGAAVVVAKLGGSLERTGRRRGWAGALIAGRRMCHHPAATARLVTAVTVALIVFMQALAWQAVIGTYHAKMEELLSAVDRNVAEIGPRGAVSSREAAAYLRSVPEGHAAVVIAPPRTPGDGPITISGGCVALESLRLPCSPTPARVDVALDRRLQQLLHWDTEGGTYLKVVRAGQAELAEQAVPSANTLAVVRADGGAPAVAALKEASYRAYPRGAQVRYPGEEWLADSIPDREQGRWIRLLGVLGTGILVLAIGLSGKAEFLRQGRALAPLTVLTGGYRVFRSSAAWAIVAPLALAALAGCAIAAWTARPVARPGLAYFVPGGLMAAAITMVLAVSVVMGLWAARIAGRQARDWRA
ncbi:ABC transporter permease [Streptomyces sp. NPDC001851]|uniref:ABC transporter permease n=1 Tax=Streptomyces sp. NPDC001851 TaxID=3154529 RepID=UPI0033313927